MFHYCFPKLNFKLISAIVILFLTTSLVCFLLFNLNKKVAVEAVTG